MVIRLVNKTPTSIINVAWIVALLYQISTANAFGTAPRKITPTTPKSVVNLDSSPCCTPISNTRRILLQSTAALILASPPSYAETVALEEEVPMKMVTDELFAISVPQRFFAIRRTSKGDLPDAKTGKGRRGGTIFTAGDMGKAEVVAVERFPTKALLEEEGISPTGDLSTFTSIGDPATIATLIIRRREKDKPGTVNSAILDKKSVQLSDDGMTLSFSLQQQINVEKPELLMETMGVTELFRSTVAKATLNSRDGNIMAVFASALDQDFKGGDGVALRKAVDSFVALDQSSTRN